MGVGWAIDCNPRRSSDILIANLLTIGAIGDRLLGSGTTRSFVLGALLAYGAGWAWVGLFEFAIVSDHRLSDSSVTGIAQTGL